MSEIKVDVDLSKYTPTELILEVQKLSYRDPEINDKICAALRKIAEGIEGKRVGITDITTTVHTTHDSVPTAVLKLEFYDMDLWKKQTDKMKDQSE